LSMSTEVSKEKKARFQQDDQLRPQPRCNLMLYRALHPVRRHQSIINQSNRYISQKWASETFQAER
jgi:hypothetical protein